MISPWMPADNYSTSGSAIGIMYPILVRAYSTHHLCYFVILNFNFQESNHTCLMLLQEDLNVFLLIGAIHAPHIPA